MQNLGALEAQNGAVDAQWSREGSKWSPGWSVVVVDRITLMWSRIRTKVKSWIRIHIKVMRVRNPASEHEACILLEILRSIYLTAVCVVSEVLVSCWKFFTYIFCCWFVYYSY
jgi:hypothetical protein